MKKLLILSTIIVLTFAQLSAQKNQLQPLGINLENVDYPFPVDYFELDIQGEHLKMAYMDVLPSNWNGKTIALLHGKNFNGAYWEQTARELSDKGFRVIIPDQIGFGKSSKPHRIQYSFQLFALNTKRILDKLGIEHIYVLGHSMGGMLATRFALMYPEMTEKLILINPIGLEDWKTVVPYQSVDELYQAELQTTFESMKNYQSMNYYDNKWKPEYDKWIYLLTGIVSNIDYPRVAYNQALISEMIMNQPVCYEFGNIKCPTLLIIGTRDRTALGKLLVAKDIAAKMGNYAQLGKITANKIPNSTLVELENIGHLPHIEAYDKFINPLLDFLLK